MLLSTTQEQNLLLGHTPVEGRSDGTRGKPPCVALEVQQKTSETHIQSKAVPTFHTLRIGWHAHLQSSSPCSIIHAVTDLCVFEDSLCWILVCQPSQVQHFSHHFHNQHHGNMGRACAVYVCVCVRGGGGGGGGILILCVCVCMNTQCSSKNCVCVCARECKGTITMF